MRFTFKRCTFLFCLICVSFPYISYAQSTIEPILNTSWHQSTPFNNMCPIMAEGKHSAAGCGAVAVGQILNYYKLPSNGYGRVVNNGKEIDISNIRIDWDNILNEYKAGQYNNSEAEAIANLIYLAGLSIGMKYGSSSTPAPYGGMISGLQHHLHISPKSRYLHRRNYSTTEWKRLIDQQLALGYPVIYRGSYRDLDNKDNGHIFVIDGKNADGLYHVRFGQTAKSYDKYIDLDYINQSNGENIHPGGKFVCYNHIQAMIVNCFPESNIKEDAYEEHPMILEQAFYLNNDPLVNEYSTTLGQWTDISYKLTDCSFNGGKAYFEMGAFKNGELQFLLESNRHYFTFSAGATLKFITKYKVPLNILNGEYEIELLYRHSENEVWKRCWDDAPNKMKMKVNGNRIIYESEINYALSQLTLNSEISEIESDGKYRIFKLDISNKSQANFEDTLMLSFDDGLSKYEYKYNTSVYEGCNPSYHLYIDSSKIPSKEKCNITAYYYSRNQEKYIPLKSGETGMYGSQMYNDDDDIVVYDINGIAILKCKNKDLKTSINKHGVYVIKNNKSVRKIVH